MDFQMLRKSAEQELMQYRQLVASSDPDHRAKAAAIHKALSALPDRERDILEQVYVNRQKRRNGHPARLSTKYGLGTSAIHKLKCEALWEYCICMVAARTAGGNKTT